MGEVVEAIIGIAVLILIVGTAIGWLLNVVSSTGGSQSDFDTKDPGDDAF